jgi:hypothetical protein
MADPVGSDGHRRPVDRVAVRPDHHEVERYVEAGVARRATALGIGPPPEQLDAEVEQHGVTTADVPVEDLGHGPPRARRREDRRTRDGRLGERALPDVEQFACRETAGHASSPIACDRNAPLRLAR